MSDAQKTDETKEKKKKRPTSGALVPQADPEQAMRGNELVVLYYKWDMEGLEYVDIVDLQRVFQTFHLPDAARTEEIQRGFEDALGDGLIPATGLPRESFCSTMMKVLQDLSTEEFMAFSAHVHGTIEFLNDLTEEGRKKQAVWQLFMDWDADRSGFLEYRELETVIRNTKNFCEQQIDNRILVTSFLGTSIPENTTQFQEFVQRIKDENLGLDLHQFHSFLNRLLLNCTEDEFYEAVQQIHQCIEYEKKEYIVSKYIANASLTAQRHQKAGEPDDPLSTALKSDRNQDLKGQRIRKLRQEIKHAFDAVNCRDVEDVTQHQFPPAVYETVAAAVCLLFKVTPRKTSHGEHQHLDALRMLINANFKGFVTALCNFNTSSLNYTQVRRVMKFYFDPLFDSNRLVQHNWFLSALCTWVKKIVHIACYENDWIYPPPTLTTSSQVESTTKPTTNVSLDVLTAGEGPSSTLTGRELTPRAYGRLKPGEYRAPAVDTSKSSTPRLPILDTVFNRGSPRRLIGHSELQEEYHTTPTATRPTTAPSGLLRLPAPVSPRLSSASPRKQITA